jgi:hypothetical protein
MSKKCQRGRRKVDRRKGHRQALDGNTRGLHGCDQRFFDARALLKLKPRPSILWAASSTGEYGAEVLIPAKEQICNTTSALSVPSQHEARVEGAFRLRYNVLLLQQRAFFGWSQSYRTGADRSATGKKSTEANVQFLVIVALKISFRLDPLEERMSGFVARQEGYRAGGRVFCMLLYSLSDICSQLVLVKLCHQPWQPRHEK